MGAVPPAIALASLVAAALAAPASASARGGGRGARGEVVLAGERVPVRWTDGDTFRVDGGRFAGAAARLTGVNALETYGPVHRLGAMDGAALLALAKATGPLAAARTWTCHTTGDADRYGRLLVSCPDAALALVSAGHAMVFALDGRADPALLAAQRRAQGGRVGMWAGGVPPLVPTSLHAAGEAGLGPRGAYDRVVDTRTGLAEARPHVRRYAICEEVCLGEGADRACLVYVPYERRYGHRPACLR
jgi:endonuclease YncB( thermonuclease family)